jgi:hypothetical protein
MAQYCDYKWWYVKRDDDGVITEVAVRFYEGDYQTIDDKQVYVRSAKLGANAMPQARGGAAVTDSLSNHAQRYTQADFGIIKTDDELRAFCDQQLALDGDRTPIPEQTVTHA